MISLHHTTNAGLLRELARGHERRIGVTQATRDHFEATLHDPRNLFFVAYDGPSAKGYVAFHYVVDGVYAIHLCLRTLGRRTVDAVSKAIDRVKDFGAVCVLAVFPSLRRDLRRLADALGFTRDESLVDVYTQPGISAAHYRLSL